jgi:hypothetical protein
MFLLWGKKPHFSHTLYPHCCSFGISSSSPIPFNNFKRYPFICGTLPWHRELTIVCASTIWLSAGFLHCHS